jgi:hypothetical protein
MRLCETTSAELPAELGAMNADAVARLDRIAFSKPLLQSLGWARMPISRKPNHLDKTPL